MQTAKHCIGLDIGGANLKLGSSSGYSDHVTFPLWKRPNELQLALEQMLSKYASAATHPPMAIGVTMTGELADCYSSRAAGVLEICNAVTKACPIAPLFYSTQGKWVSSDTVTQSPLDLAASNWHALASWIASDFIGATEQAIVLDIGSTTTDVIPVVNSQVATNSLTDRDRLHRQELVYTGMRRTPVAALLSTVNLAGHSCPVMAETFATSDDAYLALGLVEESPDDFDTADGRPRIRQAALQRLARMVGEDYETLGAGALEIAQQTIDAQTTRIANAIETAIGRLSDNSRPTTIALSGQGTALFERVRRILKSKVRVIDLVDQIGPAASQAGPAVAVAHLVGRRDCTN